jgi:hypothetical protein
VKSSGLNRQVMRKTAVHHGLRGGSSVLSSRGGHLGCASVQSSGLACASVPGCMEQRPQAAWIQGVSDGIASRSTRQSCGSVWIPEIAACFCSFSDGIRSKSDGSRGAIINSAGLLDGFSRETYNTRGNPVNTRRNPADTLAICTDSLRFQQEIAPFRRTKKKIRRETLGVNRGVSGIQTPVDRAQACSSKHPDGFREVPF